MRTHFTELPKNRLELVLEALLACPGSCGGCPVTDEEKKADLSALKTQDGFSFWTQEQWDGALSFLARLSDLHGDNVHDLAIEFAQGDYLLLPDEDLAALASFLGKASKVRPNWMKPASVTTSMIMKPALFRERALALRDAFAKENVGLYIEFGFSPANLSNPKVAELYRENLSFAIRHFPVVDVNINIGPDCLKTDPKATHEFLNSFDGLFSARVNMLTTLSQRFEHRLNHASVLRWLSAFIDQEDARYGLAFKPVFAKRWNPDSRIEAYVSEQNARDLSRMHFVDNKGRVFFSNVIPVYDRYGFEPHWDLSRASADLLRPAMEAHAFGALRQMFANSLAPSCSGCDLRLSCFKNGMHILGKSLGNPKDKHCYLGAKDVLELVHAKQTLHSSSGDPTE